MPSSGLGSPFVRTLGLQTWPDDPSPEVETAFVLWVSSDASTRFDDAIPVLLTVEDGRQLHSALTRMLASEDSPDTRCRS